VQKAQDGVLTEDEKDELMNQVKEVEYFENLLSDEVKACIQQLTRRKSVKVAQEVRGQLATEQVFMFSLCHFADSIRTYCKWLAEERTADTFEDSIRSLCGTLRFYIMQIVDMSKITSANNIKFVARISIAMFAGFSISYVGYGHVITAKDATIPSKIAVLLSHSVVSPTTNMFDRLTGIMLGKFLGKLAYALLGWCYPVAQISMAIVVFVHVLITLTVYHYTSRFSPIGMLAAAFGTEAFLQGCDNETAVFINAQVLVNFLIAICIMTLTERIVSMGIPSELAYEEYLQAWHSCLLSLRGLFTSSPEDTKLKVADYDVVASYISRAETFASEAAYEQRCWRRPFPVELFSNMTNFASWMRGQLICIQTVAYGEESNRNGGLGHLLIRSRTLVSWSGDQKNWFKRILQDEVWKSQVEGLLEEMGDTMNMITQLQEENKDRITTIPALRSASTASYAPLGRQQHVAPIPESRGQYRPGKPASPTSKRKTACDIEQHLIARTSAHQSTTQGKLVEDEDVQRAFIAGCLESIRQRNFALQVEITKVLRTDRGTVEGRSSDSETEDCERIRRASPRIHRMPPQMRR